MISNVSKSGVGDPIVLVSEQGNHSPQIYAASTAKMVIDITDLKDERRKLGQLLRRKVADILVDEYAGLMMREIQHLTLYSDHCDAEYEVMAPASRAVNAIYNVVLDSPWAYLAMNQTWRESVLNTIASHLATALHVERLLFADLNPHNSSAIAYKARFQ